MSDYLTLKPINEHFEKEVTKVFLNFMATTQKSLSLDKLLISVSDKLYTTKKSIFPIFFR